MPLLSFRSARLGHGHGGLEQVPVHRQLEGPALELRQAAGDGQPQPGALGGPGLVPRTKRSINRSGGTFSGSREMFLIDRVTCPFPRTSSR